MVRQMIAEKTFANSRKSFVHFFLSSNYGIRNTIFLVLYTMLYSGLVRYIRRIGDTVHVSDKVEANIQKSLDDAEKKIRNDKQALMLMKRLDKEKTIDKTILMNEDQINFEKLIDLGLVDMFLNNTVSLSGMGVRILGKI
jgi:hypothetical protein